MFLYTYGAKQKSTKAPPMFAKGQIIEIFFKLDEFWKKFSRFSPKCIEQTNRETLPSWWQNVGTWDHVDYDSVPFLWLPMSQAYLPQRRIRQHKVFAVFAERGCCSMGWFYGFYPSPYSEHYLLTEFICWLVWKLTWRARSCPPETAC